MSEIMNKIKELALEYEEDMVAFTQKLIRTKSISSEEEGVAQLYQEEMKKLGYDEVFQDAAGNVVGLIKGEGPVIMYNSHMDHVSEGDLSNWEGYNPYGAEIDVCEVDNREKTGTELARCIHGRTEYLITVYGRTSHGSAPWLGINAVYKAMPLIAKIKDELYPSLPSDSELGQSSISLNIIECSPGALSIVPDKCMLSIDRRTIPGESDEEVLEQFQKCIDEIAAEDPEFKADVIVKGAVEKTYTGLELDERKKGLAWKMPVDHPFTRACTKGLEQIGQNPKLDYWVFATDMCLNSGRDHKPAIGYSPMQEQYAHTPYDKVRIDFMREALSGNVAIFLSCCETGEEIGTRIDWRVL